MISAVASRLEGIKKRGGMTGREVAQLLDTRPETVSRWQTGRTEPHPDRLHRLLALDWLMEELADLYPPEEARLWLFSPHRLLSRERPADLIQRDEIDRVLAVIEQLKTGAYV